jgi:hypothetical protein
MIALLVLAVSSTSHHLHCLNTDALMHSQLPRGSIDKGILRRRPKYGIMHPNRCALVHFLRRISFLGNDHQT